MSINNNERVEKGLTNNKTYVSFIGCTFKITLVLPPPRKVMYGKKQTSPWKADQLEHLPEDEPRRS
jgi:hypothetical protein